MRSAIFILIIFAFSSCDIFSTRSPEEPEQPRSNFIVATRPQDVILNLQNSFADRVVENYIASLSKSGFNFLPSSGATLNYPVLQNWDLKSEEQYFINLVTAVPNTSQINLDFIDPEYQQYNDSVLFFAEYSLNVPFNDDRPKFYSGKVQFTIQRDSSLQWAISNWIDIKDHNSPSWSELKGGLY